MGIVVIDCSTETDLVTWGVVHLQLALACVEHGVPLPWRRSSRFRRERAVA